VPRYLVELYAPVGQHLDEVVGRAQRMGEPDVRYVRTMFVAEDETCFHVFEAPSREAVSAAATKNGFADARITEAVERDGTT
jgi:hypothetical protein